MVGFFSFFLVLALIPPGSSLALISLRDVVPFALAATFLMAAWGLFRRRPSSLVAEARERLFEGLNDAVVVLDTQDRVVDLNPAAQQTLGLAVTDVLGQPFAQVCSPWPELAKLVRDRKRPCQEITLRGEGGPRHLEVSLTNLDDGRGHPAGRLLVLRDTTEQKQAADQLREEGHHLEQAVEVLEAVTKGTEVMVAALDMEFRYVFFNEAYHEEIRRLTGKDIGIGSNMIDTFADMPEQQAVSVSQWSRTLHGASAKYRIEFGDSEPSRRVYSVRRTPLWDAQGNVIGAGEISFDITKRVQAGKALADSEQHYRRLFDTMLQGVVYQDVEGTIISMNPAAERILGKSQAELLGQSSVSVEHDTLREDGSPFPGLEHPAMVALRTGRGVSDVLMQVYNPREQQYRWINITAMPLFKEGESTPYQAYTIFHDITERKRVVDALQESRAKLEAALSSTSDAVFVSDAQGRLIEFNDAFATFHRFRNRDECSKTFAEYPDILDMFLPDGTLAPVDMWAVPRALRGEVATDAAYTLRRKDTGETWVGSYSFSPIRDPNGEIVGSVVVARDITERKQVEEALRDSEKQYRELVRYASAGIYEVDFRNKRFVSVNEAMCQMLGYSREELLAMDPFDFLDEEGQALFRTQMAQWLGGEEPDKNVEFRVKTRDGRFIDAILNVTFTTDENGQLLGATVVAHDVTERKQAADALRTSEERFRLSVENLLDAFAVYSSIRDADGRIVDFRVEFANEAACQLTNRKRENYVGRTILELYPDLRQTPIFDWYVEVVETGKHLVKEDLAFDTTPHGRPGVRYYDWRVTRLGDGFTATWRDVTGRKQAHDELEERVKERTEELLQKNEQLRQEIEERSSTEHLLRLEGARLDALVRLTEMNEADPSKIVEFVLEQGIALTQSMIGFVGFLSEDESIYNLSAVSRNVVKDCEVAEIPVPWRVADAGIWADAIRQRQTLFINDYSQPDPRKKGLPPGHPRVEKFMVVPIFEAGKVVAVAGVGNKAADYNGSDERQIALLLDRMWNHLQRHHAREALRNAYDELQASEERFRQLAANVREVFWMIEPGTRRVLYVSPAYDAIWGRSREELYERPRSFLDTVHPDDRPGLLRGVTTNWRAYDGEFRILRPDGAVRWIQIRSFPVYSEKGEAYRLAGLATDRTEQKAAEAALFQAERLTIAGKLAATLAHEINNPLQSVVGCLGLAKGALKEGRDPATYLQIAHEEVRRTVRFVGQLRSLGQPVQEGSQEPTDLNRLIDDVLILNKKHFQGHKVKVLWEPDSGLPLLAAVPDALRQVFLNLVLNAIDAMPEGGQLRISTVSTESPDGVQVVVADTGKGVAHDAMPHLFEAFYSTKPEGLGVGLYVSQTIVQQHGGRIEVESQPGTGTRFTVWLPS